MCSKDRAPNTICVVDDEPNITDLYATWLSDDYHVRSANDGTEALRNIDETVSVVLLDRRMPGLSGADVLTEIERSGYDCKVAIITAVRPTIDVVDMEFDAYLVKPVHRDEIRELVGRLIRQMTFSDSVQELFAVSTKKVTLEGSLAQEELSASEEYRRLLTRYAELRDAVFESTDGFGARDFVTLFKDIENAGAAAD